MSTLTEQLRDELGAAASAVLGAFASPDLLMAAEQMAYDRAPMLASNLAQDEDDKLSAQTAVDVMGALWPHGDPEDYDPGWWSTPLGRMIARSVGRDDSDAVSPSVAAAMLGITPSTVHTMLRRGDERSVAPEKRRHHGLPALDRHPDGGVTRASVLARLAAAGGS